MTMNTITFYFQFKKQNKTSFYLTAMFPNTNFSSSMMEYVKINSDLFSHDT